MDIVVEIKNLNKGFLKKKVIKGMNLQLSKGKIYGLLGPNGSGKTTMMKILANLLKPTSGEVLINGEKLGTNTKEFVSYMPTDDYLYNWMQIKNAIKFYDDMYSDFNVEKAEKLIDYMELDKELKISHLSTGMKGRLKIALALSRKVVVYMLDEPLNGIDPISREKIVKAIVAECNIDNTILISSHLVHEMEPILDEVVFIKNGDIELQGNAEEYRKEKGISIEELYKEVYR